jgi:hypothetical protein
MRSEYFGYRMAHTNLVRFSFDCIVVCYSSHHTSNLIFFIICHGFHNLSSTSRRFIAFITDTDSHAFKWYEDPKTSPVKLSGTRFKNVEPILVLVLRAHRRYRYLIDT